MKKTKNFSNKTGSSIIELLIAVMIVGTIVTATAIAMTYTIRNSAEARYRDVASSLAQDGMEYFRQQREMLGWEQFNTSYPNGTKCTNEGQPITNGLCTTSFTKSNTSYKRHAVITRPVAGTIQIVITVTWNIGSSVEPKISVTQRFKDRF